MYVGSSEAPLRVYCDMENGSGGWLVSIIPTMNHWPNADLMLGQRRRRWPNIKSALVIVSSMATNTSRLLIHLIFVWFNVLSEDLDGLATIWRLAPCSRNVLLRFWECSKLLRLFGALVIFTPNLKTAVFLKYSHAVANYLPGSPNVRQLLATLGHFRCLFTKMFLCVVSNSLIDRHAPQLVANVCRTI